MPAGISSIFTTWSELASTTYRRHDADVSDNVSKHNALYRRLTSKGRKHLADEIARWSQYTNVVGLVVNARGTGAAR